MHYTREQIDDMKARCDLVELARYCGYTPIRKGNTYSLKEHDSVRIFNHRTFMQFSSGVGGDAIVFLQHFNNCTFQEAAERLGDFTGITGMTKQSVLNPRPILDEKIKQERVPFVLPEAAENYKRLYAYLIKTRCIDKSIVDYCVKNHFIYESAKHHNIVFLSRDKEGNVHHAFMRGTNEACPFKSDVAGNNKHYGFNIPAEGKELRVFESAIDALSEWTLTRDSSVSRLALGGVFDAPLETYLVEHPEIEKIELCLDGDAPGRQAANDISNKYVAKGYIVEVKKPEFPNGMIGKDFNDLCRHMQSALTPRQLTSRHTSR